MAVSTSNNANGPAVSGSSIEDQLEQMPVGRTHWKIIITLGLGLFFDLYGIFLSGSIGVALTSNFELSEGPALSILAAVTFFGMFLGSVFLGGLADKIGRRRAFLLNLVWFSLWSVVAAFSPTFWFLVIIRGLAGVGLGALYPVADSYLQEILPKEHRGWLASWTYTISFLAVPLVGFLAILLNGAEFLGGTGWRWLLALGGIGGLLVLLLRHNLVESPRWLAAQGRAEEAKAALQVFADGSEVKLLPVLALESAPCQAQRRRFWRARWNSLSRPLYRKRMVMLVVFHLFQTFGYFGFGTLAMLVLLSRGQTVTNSLLFISLSFLGYPTGSLISTPLIQLIERKTLLIGSVIMMAAFGMAFAISTDATLIIAFGFLLALTNNVFSNVYHIYQAEIFPTESRATAIGWSYSVSRLSSAALPFILLPVLHAWGPVAAFSLVAVALLIACAAIGFLGPRTSGRPLAEISPL